jgi:flagellar assembly factor FliW
MEITSRFGPLAIEADHLLTFPTGLLGLEDCRQWVLLTDPCTDALAWLQSVDRPQVALPVVSPRRFVAGYQARIARRELAPLELNDMSVAKVLVIVGRAGRGLGLNLKAPIVINPQRRLGRQIITNGELPVCYELEIPQATARRIA